MKRSSKVIFAFLLVIVLLILGVFLFLRYRKGQAENQLVRLDAIALIRVDSDKLVWDLARELFFEKDTAEGEGISNFWNAGVEFPAVCYFFSLPGQGGIWHTVVRVRDKAKFQSYLQSRLDTEVLPHAQGEWSITASEQKIRVLGDDSLAIFSIGNRAIPEEVSSEILAKKSALVGVKELPIWPAWDSDDCGTIAYKSLQDSTEISADFSKGKMLFSGVFQSELWRLSEQGVDLDQSKDRVLVAKLRADIRPILRGQRGFFEKYNIDIDSIERYIGNYWELAIDTGVVQQDELVVTYDYDDNFELIEKHEVQQSNVPNLFLLVKASPHLASYLPDRFFYRFYRYVQDGFIGLSTAEMDTITPRLLPSDGVDDVVAHFVFRRHENSKLPIPIPLPNTVLKVDLIGRRKSPTALTVEGMVDFRDKAKHPLRQLAW